MVWVPRKKWESFSRSSIFWTHSCRIAQNILFSRFYHIVLKKPGQGRSWNRSEGQLHSKLCHFVQNQNLEISLYLKAHENVTFLHSQSNPVPWVFLTIVCRISAIQDQGGTHKLPILKYWWNLNCSNLYWTQQWFAKKNWKLLGGWLLDIYRCTCHTIFIKDRGVI